MPLHGLGVAAGQDEGCPDAALGTDGAEDIGRLGALVLGGPGPGAAFRPAPGDLVLLADPRFVLWDGSPPPWRISFPPQIEEVQNEHQADWYRHRKNDVPHGCA